MGYLKISEVGREMRQDLGSVGFAESFKVETHAACLYADRMNNPGDREE